MAEQIIKMRIQFRRDTTANWEAYKDIVPYVGEPCYDSDLGTLKIGDGKTAYGDLPVVGGGESVAVAADGSSIALENGVFKLAGFDAAATGAQPRKTADGKLEWVIPTVVDTSELEADIAALKSKMDGNGEGSVNARIIAKINEFATQITDDDVVNSYQELIDYVAKHGGEAASMIADIESLKSLVGNESVEKQIADAIAEIGGAPADCAIDSIKLGENVLDPVDKTVTIPVGAGLKESEEIDIADDGTLSIGYINFNKIVTSSGDSIVLDGGSAG